MTALLVGLAVIGFLAICGFTLHHGVKLRLRLEANSRPGPAEDSGGPTTMIVCQGPPRCALSGDDAINEQKRGCVWCERIIIDDDGAQRVEKPGEA